MACDGHAHEHMQRMRMAFAVNVYFIRFCEVRYKVALRMRCECALYAPYSPRIEVCHDRALCKPHVSPCLTVVQWSSAYSLSTA